jgi:hypothetical protein
MTVSRGLNLGSHRTYDEIWYAYFSDQTSPDYVFPMILFDVTEEAASIFKFNDFGGAPDLMAPLPFFNNSSGVRNNILVSDLNRHLSLYRWLCLTSGVTDITLKSSQSPIYFSLYIAIRDSDLSFRIRSPEQIISHHVIWLGDTLEVEELKKMPGASFMIYNDNEQTRINASIHQGSWMQRYINYIVSRIRNTRTVPSNVIEEIIDTYYVYFLKPTLNPNAQPRHTFLNPFYVGVIVHYVNNWEDDMISITDVINSSLFVSLDGVSYPVIRLTSDFIKYSISYVAPCDVPLGGSWPSPNRGITNGETLTIYNYYNWPHSLHYSTEKDISGLPNILYGVTNSYAKEKALLTVTFHTDNIYIPVPNSSNSIKTSVLNPPRTRVPAVSVNYLLDSVSSYTRQKLHRCYPNAPIHILYIDEDAQYAGHINYGYYIFDLRSTYQNWSDFRVSSFIWVANSNDVNEGYYGSFHFISFYTSYPFVIDARVKTSGYENHPVLAQLTVDKDKIGFYYNPLYPLAKRTTVRAVEGTDTL